jgi:hypothetical protein
VSSGWSNWSSPVTITRVNKPAVAIVNPPGATTEDGTPPIDWTVTGGTQTKWEVLVKRNGVTVSSSLERAGTDTLWTPTAGAKSSGDVLTLVVRSWDSVVRAASPGDPEYAEATLVTVYTPSAVVSPVSTLTAATDAFTAPVPHFEWTRGALPDWVDVERAGGIVARLGPDETPWTDWSCPPNQDVTYRFLAGVDPSTADTGPEVTLNIAVEGLWIVDPVTERGFVLAGQDLQIGYGDVTGVYTGITASELVTRVSSLRGAEGAMRGIIDVWPGRTVEQQRDDVWWLRANPRAVRLIAGDLNIPVGLRGLETVFDTDLSTTDRIARLVRFDFHQVDGELPWLD